MTEINELERKKILRKKEERREARGSERKGNVYLMRKGERSVIKKIYFFFTFELQCTSIFRCAL